MIWDLAELQATARLVMIWDPARHLVCAQIWDVGMEMVMVMVTVMVMVMDMDNMPESKLF